ncbi:MAG: glutathione S-transferase [Rhodoferax sp.]|nr:glutathione S-transferase [Rhodoferax sp.]
MLTIWGRLSSINVRKAVWAAQEVGVAFERIDAGAAFGVVKTPPYLRLNPNALVPVLQDGDLTLWESNVIVRYLCARYGAPTLAAARVSLPPEGSVPGLGRPGAAAHRAPALYPEPLAQRFNAERWMDWQQTTLNPAGRNAFMQLIRTAPEQRQAHLIEQSNQDTEPLMAMLDTHLREHAFMAGDHFTMADIPIGCEVHRWFGLPQAHPPRPHLDRWYQTLCERPASMGVLDLTLS